jgi:hypothetical protein
MGCPNGNTCSLVSRGPTPNLDGDTDHHNLRSFVLFLSSPDQYQNCTMNYVTAAYFFVIQNSLLPVIPVGPAIKSIAPCGPYENRLQSTLHCTTRLACVSGGRGAIPMDDERFRR